MTPIREELLRLISLISDETPEVRLGQLIANMATIGSGPWNETLWDLEDDQLLDALQTHVENLSARQHLTR